MLAVKNFDKFQHYKDRSPVWIKLYRSLLRDYEFAKLPDAARGQLVLIWLLASEMGNRLPNDAEWIKCQINASEAVNLSVLIEAGFLIDCDSNSDSNHDDSDMMLAQRREREEREKEKEKEREVEASRGKPRSASRRPKLCDENYIAELQANPAYAVFDVNIIYHKMAEWCRRKGKVPTQGRLLGWLNREDRPLSANVPPPKNGAAYVGAPTPSVKHSPEELEEQMFVYIEELIELRDFIHLGHEYDAIIKRGGAKAEWEIACVAWYELHKNNTEVL